MAALNQVNIIGTVTRDPELKYTKNQTAVIDVGIAINEKRKDQQGNWVEDVCFCDVTFFGRTAEVCGEFLSKGSSVYILGKLKLDTWEQEGQRRSKLKIVGDKMQMLGQRQSGDSQERAPSRQEHNQQPPDEIPF